MTPALAEIVDQMRPGVLNKHQIKRLAGEGVIRNLSDNDEDIGFSSFNLRLSRRGWEMKGSVKGLRGRAYIEVITEEKLCQKELDLSKKQCLRKKHTYVLLLEESLDFPPTLWGVATGRSTIGRLDILTRLIVDKSSSYDEVCERYSGPLYLEITPITFDAEVQQGLSVGQLRLFRGHPSISRLEREELTLYGRLIVDDRSDTMDHERTCELKVDLQTIDVGGQPTYAFKARGKRGRYVDLTLGSGSHNPRDFWERLPTKGQEKLDIIEIYPEQFYILRSKERFKLPRDVAVYAQAVSEQLGELRIHYAGFVHPGFGFYREDGRGAPVIFEVRGHNVKTFLRDGETLARIQFYKMSEPYDYSPEDIEKERESGYTNQELKLSKYFEDWVAG